MLLKARISRFWQESYVPSLVHKRHFNVTALRKTKQASHNEEDSIERTRNIGIIAHIDAVSFCVEFVSFSD